MKQIHKPLVFFGNERLATGVSTETPILKALISSGYDVKAVVSNYTINQSRSSRSLEITEVAKEYNIPLLLPTNLKEIKQQLLDYRAQAGVLVAYGKIIPQEIIDIFPFGIINVHPSLLPLHRGPTPIESVIINGDEKTGVSIMQLAKAMDAGPVYGQAELKLTGDESKQSLADTLLDVGRAMLVELLPGILSGSVTALPQDDAQATYDSLISKDDGVVDWDKPAKQLEREVRAFTEWPKSRSTIAGIEVIVTGAHAVTADHSKPGAVEAVNNTLTIHCGKGCLRIDRLKPVGKPEMSSAAFLAGYGKNLA